MTAPKLIKPRPSTDGRLVASTQIEEYPVEVSADKQRASIDHDGFEIPLVAFAGNAVRPPSLEIVRQSSVCQCTVDEGVGVWFLRVQQ
jgi:hypothetical protein